jgi:glycosyltransferase involved in cell wall biosynthesis
MKIVIINSHPIQYLAPLYKLLSSEDTIEFIVYYCSDHSLKGGYDPQFGQKLKWDIPLLEGYTYKFIKNYSPLNIKASKFFGVVNPGIFKELKKDKPDVVLLNGWAYFSYLLAFFYALILKIDIWIRIETPLKQEIKKTSFVSKTKRFMLRYFYFPKIKRGLFIGDQNKKFLEFMGVSKSKLFFTPYAVDNSRFRLDFESLKNKKSELRTEFGISQDGIVFLTSGKLISKKRPLDLLMAFHEADISNSYLIFLGDGGLRLEIEQYIKENRIENVFITGFKNQTKIAPYFVVSDVFVLCSGVGETWGLVTNEAMNFNLPIVISDLVGSTDDLVIDNENGFIYPYASVSKLSERLIEMNNNKKNLMRYGGKSSEIIQKYSYRNIILGLLSAGDYLMKKDC